MVAAIRKVTPAPIRRIVVDHYHADHIWSRDRWRRLCGDLGARQGQRPTSLPGVAEARLAPSGVWISPWVDETTRVVLRMSGWTATPTSVLAA